MEILNNLYMWLYLHVINCSYWSACFIEKKIFKVWVMKRLWYMIYLIYLILQKQRKEQIKHEPSGLCYQFLSPSRKNVSIEIRGGVSHVSLVQKGILCIPQLYLWIFSFQLASVVETFVHSVHNSYCFF